MNSNTLVTAILLAMLPVAGAAAQSEFFEQFKRDYDALNVDLLNSPAERAKIEDFVYERDVGTFTFEEGTIHLLRYVQGRPTMAIFVGRGHAHVEVPSRVERDALYGMARDSLVEEDFEVAIVRMADDFDLALKERFVFEEKPLKWKTFTIAKQAHGEEFFKPTMLHTYDNYFQLLRSVYERAPDGFFWISFNRYVYVFDPNRPEQVNIEWEVGVSELIATPTVAMQRQEAGRYADSQLSLVGYPTTVLEKSGDLTLGGIDGFALDNGGIRLTVLINADSLRYLSAFLQYRFELDSLMYDGVPVEFIRRNDFDYVGIVLPEYRHRGDTVEFTFWYDGKNFDRCLPYVENPQAAPHNLTFTVPGNYNYYVPGLGAAESVEGKLTRYPVSSSNQYRDFYFHAYPGGVDTIALMSDMGITLNVLRSQHLSQRLVPCFINDEKYRATVLGSFNHMTGYLGAPINTFSEFVIPERTASMPGLIMVPQTSCAMEAPMASLGSFDYVAAEAVARQWFGSLLRPATYREFWVAEALPPLLALLYVQKEQGAVYFNNLMQRRDTLVNETQDRRDMPLAAGTRVSQSMLSNKGLWMMHMLRFVMYDIEANSEATFLRFLQELSVLCNTATFTNSDVIALAERRYGAPLGWFFDHWLYGRGVPEFDVEYQFGRADAGYTVDLTVETKKVNNDFSAVVPMTVEFDDGSRKTVRDTISAPQVHLTLGPFEKSPAGLRFNEFYAVLCKSSVKEK